MKITEKLKEVLSEEDLKTFEDSVKKMIDEQVELRVDEKTTELEEKAEEFCEQEITKKVAEEKEALIESYDLKMEELENNMVERLDGFLDAVITEQISDETLTKIAINETLEPLVEGIKTLFEEKYVALDTDGQKLVAEAKEEVKKLKDENSDLLADKIELSELAEMGSIRALVAESTRDLTETQIERVKALCEGKSFDEVEGKITAIVEMVSESEDSEKENLDENEDPNLSDKDSGDPKGAINENKKEEEDNKDNLNEDVNDDDDPMTSIIDSVNNYL